MVPFKVSEFPRSYPALLAVSTSCFLRYNKWCLLGIQPQVLEPLTLEEGEDFLQFQKEVKKLLKLKVNFKRKCLLYEEIYKKYGSSKSEEKVYVCDQLGEEEEDDHWEDSFEEIPMEETGSK
ncbi:movement protein [Beet curly top Iran virus]|uniref:Movement protein n=1 Tax=Beet curly top Iran virus TaxID=391228 RepID=L7XA56_9GEMI|nr:movement protein [Beet curly top Iran virus]